MNLQTYERAKQAYTQGDYNGAIASLKLCKAPGELAGSVDHLLGNCYMKLNMYDLAACAYGEALRDSSYAHVGPLACNRGRAFLAAKKYEDAIASLLVSLKDEHYTSAYKAHLALGSCYLKLNNARDAGVNFRAAAIDENNPAPAFALKQLGHCFMLLGRAVDAIEAFRTALDFSTPLAEQNSIYSDLGLAYVAANRMSEAVDAFSKATKDASFTLSPQAQAAFDAASKAVAAVVGATPSETDSLLAATGYGSSTYDPLDPTGKSGAFMPSPEDTGFFSINEEDLVENDKKQRKVKRKHKHTGLKIFLSFIVLLLIVAGLVGFAFYKGYGYPTQEMLTTQLFSLKAQTGSTAPLIASSVSSSDRQALEALLPQDAAKVDVMGVDRSMNSALVYARATLSAGGQQDYKISFVREGFQFKVSSLEVVYPSKDKPAKLDTSSHNS